MRITAGLRHLVAYCAMASSAPLPADQSAHRQHESHVHGEGVLEVAVDGSELLVTLRVPAANVVGFEHAPASETQRKLVEAAERRFGQGDSLLVPETAAGCTLERSEARLGAGRANEKEHEHQHGKGHEHDERAAAPAGDETHSELHAEYQFRCKTPTALSAIDVRLFDALTDTRSLRARVVTPRYQGATRLTPDRTRLPMAR